MRVAHVVPNTGSGIEHSIANLLSCLDDNAVESHVLFLRAPVPPHEALPRLAKSVWYAREGSSYYGMLTQLRAKLRQISPEILHAHSFLPSVFSLLASANPNCKAVRTFHSPYPYFSSRSGRARAKRMAEAIVLGLGKTEAVCVARSVAEAMPSFYPKNPTIIRNGVQSGSGSFSYQERTTSSMALLCVGRLEEEKNFGLAIEALALVRNTGLDVTLKIAGTGGQEQDLRRKAVSLGLGDHVEFLGFVADINPLLQDAAALICSSRFEGAPLAILDAMAAGCPVVAVPIPAVLEVASLGRGALQVADAPTPEALARSVCLVITRQDITRAQVELAKLAVQSHYSSRLFADSHLNLYRRLLDRKAQDEI